MLGCSCVCVCLYASRAIGLSVCEQGPCRFQFPEVSAGPEEAWELIHQPSRRPHCEASLHTQIWQNIRVWIQSHCLSPALAGSNSNGRFADYIHGQRVNLLCSPSQTNTHRTGKEVSLKQPRTSVLLSLSGLSRHLHRAPFSLMMSLCFCRYAEPDLLLRGNRKREGANIKQTHDVVVKLWRTTDYQGDTVARRGVSRRFALPGAFHFSSLLPFSWPLHTSFPPKKSQAGNR